MKILILLNSIFGKRGNIGYRTEQLIKNTQINEYILICRDAHLKFKNTAIYKNKFFGHIPRILNAARIYFFPKFNHRYLDIYIFEKICSFFLKQHQLNSDIYHFWEYTPSVMKDISLKGGKIILDIPIATSNYIKFLNNTQNLNLQYSEKFEGIEKRSIELADKIIVPSQFIKDIVSDLVPKKINDIHVIPFGVDVTKFKPSEKMLEEPKFCFAGNISRRKGSDILIEIFKKEKFQKYDLNLYGRAYPEINLKNITSNIHNKGFVNVAKELNRNSIYIFPSWMEGSSKSIYEAMAAGLIVICSNESGSVVKDGETGFTYDASDTDGLEKIIDYVINNYNNLENIRLKAIETANKFSWRRYANNVNEIYQELNENQ